MNTKIVVITDGEIGNIFIEEFKCKECKGIGRSIFSDSPKDEKGFIEEVILVLGEISNGNNVVVISDMPHSISYRAIEMAKLYNPNKEIIHITNIVLSDIERIISTITRFESIKGASMLGTIFPETLISKLNKALDYTNRKIVGY